jgi:hypothetical protein
MLQDTIEFVTEEVDPSSRCPRPSGVRDSGDRTYEVADEWSRSAGGEDNWTDDMHQVMQQQAEHEAQATLETAYKAAMADVAARFAGWYAHGMYCMPFGTFGRASWQIVVSKGGEQLCGVGDTVWAAVDDLLAKAAGGVAA